MKKKIFFPKNKKGSHIGIILSFVIFVVFLTFLYSTMEPLITVNDDKEFMLDYLEVALIEKLNINLTTLTITIDETVSESCVILNSLIGEKGLNPTIIVKDYDKNIISSYISEEDTNNLIVDRSNSEMVFLKIYDSEELESLNKKSEELCVSLTKDDKYEIELLKSSKYISKAKVEELNETYLEEYENLKEELNIPVGSDFGFGFIYNDGLTIETKSENVSRSVYVKEVPVRYLDDKANILSGYMKIRIW